MIESVIESFDLSDLAVFAAMSLTWLCVATGVGLTIGAVGNFLTGGMRRRRRSREASNR